MSLFYDISAVSNIMFQMKALSLAAAATPDLQGQVSGGIVDRQHSTDVCYQRWKLYYKAFHLH